MMRNLAVGVALVMIGIPARAETFQESIVDRHREVGRQLAPIVPRKAAPNRIMGRKTNVSGVLVTIAKARQPLHAISPFAPEEYGSGVGNVVRDPTTGQADGITVLSIEF